MNPAEKSATARVLIADDEDDQRNGLASIVSSWGFEVETAADGQQALEKLWGYTHELFTMNPLEQRLAEAGIAVDRSQLRAAWLARIEPVLAEATLTRPADGWAVRGGRDGVHTEHLGHLLSELQYMQRAYPGLSW